MKIPARGPESNMHLLQLALCIVMLLPVQSVLAATGIESISGLNNRSADA
jgi:hypothetical protein